MSRLALQLIGLNLLGGDAVVIPVMPVGPRLRGRRSTVLAQALSEALVSVAGLVGRPVRAQDGTLVQESPVPRLEPGAWDTSAVWREGLSFVFGWRIWLNAPK